MALQQLTPEQIRTWTREQKDRWWFTNVYRGDMAQLTLRSALTGFLLGFTGVGGDNTDVLAHLTGFVTGTVTGWWLGRLSRIPAQRVQWLAGVGALAAIAIAWWAALTLGA